jgi:hypothetical protein
MGPFERGGRSRRVKLVTVFVAVCVTMALSVNPASAGQTHVFEETFGSAAEPSFSKAYSLAVHQPSGDLIVLDAGTAEVLRFKAQRRTPLLLGLGQQRDRDSGSV